MNPQNEERILAEAYGAIPRPDRRRGTDWCKYELFGWTIWEIVAVRRGVHKLMWQCARIRDNHWCDHSPQPTLTEALEFVCDVQTGELP
jgi:hypothetical protein